jgi:hypothetical protein
VERLSEIRPFTRADTGAVAALFQKTFRKSGEAPRDALEAYLVEAYLEHPWYDPEIAARVYVNDDGRVTGFVGVFPSRFEHGGRILRAAIPGTLMVENPEREPLAGAKLLRSVIKGPQEISLSETTNTVSQALWERLGGSVVPTMSLDWFRVLRPCAAALALLAERRPRASILSPVARLCDFVGGALIRRRFKPEEPPKRHAVDSSPSDRAFAEALLELSQGFELRPAWSVDDVLWFLAHAERKERYGEMHRALVRDPKGVLAGCYLYHGRAGAAGRVLQVLARKGEAGAVIDHLFHDADRNGIAVLRGRSTPDVAEALLARATFFMHRAAMAIQPARGEFADAIVNGEALITGLAGESWTRLVGGEFL